MITLRKTLVALELSDAFNLGSAVYEIMSYIFNKFDSKEFKNS